MFILYFMGQMLCLSCLSAEYAKGNFFTGDLHIQKIVVSLYCQTTKGVRQRHKIRAYSSAGLEHLPYKQGVIGSNPIGPTRESYRKSDSSFLFF